MRIFEQALLMAFLKVGAFPAHDTREEAYHGIENHLRGEFAAGEHVIADGTLGEAAAFNDALVDALEPPADEDRALPCAELACLTLRERTPTRGHEVTRASVTFGDRGIERCGEHIRADHHARATASRRIIDCAVPPEAVPNAGPLPPDTKLVSLRTEVKLGARRPGKVEILSGLSATDTVVVAGQHRLQKDGTALRVVETRN